MLFLNIAFAIFPGFENKIFISIINNDSKSIESYKCFYDDSIIKSDIDIYENKKMPLKEAAYREKILLYLGRNLNSNTTPNKIATELKLFYSLVHKTIKGFEGQGIVKAEKVGNYNLLKLNTKKHGTLLELALLSHKHKDELEKEGKISPKVDGFIEKISKDKDVLSAVLCSNEIMIFANRLTTNLEILAKTADIGNEVVLVKHDDVANILQGEMENKLLDGIVLYGYENFWRMIAESRK